MSDDVTLLPCPFCGSEHCQWVGSADGDYVECGSCLAMMRPHDPDVPNEVARWNTRTPSPDSGERMREALEPFAGVAVGEVWKHFSAENPTLRISSSDGSRHLTFVSAEWFERARAALQESAR